MLQSNEPGRPPKRYSQASRLHDIVQEISASKVGLTIRQLADRTGVGIRTIYRDIIALEMAGYPLDQDTLYGGEKIFFFMDGYKHKDVREIDTSTVSLKFKGEEEVLALEKLLKDAKKEGVSLPAKIKDIINKYISDMTVNHP